MRLLGKIIKYVSLLLWSAIILFPLGMLFFGSFMSLDEFSASQGLRLPESFLYLDNYVTAIKEGNLVKSFAVTFLIILISVMLSIFIGSMVAYVYHRFDFKGKKLLLFAYFLVSAVPMVVTQVGTFNIITSLNLYNTIWAPILLYVGADVTMIYLYLQNMEQIPVELDQAAMMDGASFFQIYRRVIFPMLVPATTTVTLLKMLSIYNDFYIPYLYMPSGDLPTISTGIYRFIGPYQTNWPLICAFILISMIPMLIIYLVLQKYIDKGLSQGSVKY
ncbi:carbohydrate ABC transporter permease [Vagococcus sp. DIV0080]|uniref:Carbohydrate ABC transporter permease n=1 Tax=Candidatus Vagococcus giribetii TaxID=2230876 RepID=A0ABS3HVJ6_9ENTE|nr:carbohydrate ABC transporter permease [Vagococcus sp. DIV0080]MBO0477787.1 carbohydrate ABC transporter permease [Vagococcus sp. DIV0080]